MSKSSMTGPARAESVLRDEQAHALCVSVLTALGRPVNFFKISAVRLWEDHFRVNVQTGADAASVLIAHSFFVATDGKGNVLESTPRITRLY
jgi:hypothetical protein